MGLVLWVDLFFGWCLMVLGLMWVGVEDLGL